MSDPAEPQILDDLIAWATSRARLLYDGVEVRHRSCGIALAETFGRRPGPYQSLRRGGITGQGECGAIKAGELILGEVFGDPDPAGPVTDLLRRAVVHYQSLWRAEIDLGDAKDIICNTLTAPFDDFRGPERHAYCTDLASQVARCVAQTILACGGEVTRQPPPEG